MKQQSDQFSSFHGKLNPLNQVMERARTREELFSGLCRAVVECDLARVAWIGSRQAGQLVAESCSGTDLESLESLRSASRHPVTGVCPVELALQENRIVHEPAVAGTCFGTVALTAFPLPAPNLPPSVLVVYASPADRSSAERSKSLDVLAVVASSALLALDRIQQQAARLRAEEMLLESQRRYQNLLEALGEGAVGIDLAFTFTFANRAAEELFGVPAGSLTARRLADFFSPEQFDILQREQAALPQLGKKTYEVELTRITGERRLCVVTATPQTDEAGHALGALLLFRDVTERRRSLRALQAGEERDRSLFDSNLAGLFRSGLDGSLLECNDALCRILGYDSRAQVCQLKWAQLYFEPTQREAVFARLLHEGSVLNCEVTMRRKDSTPVTVVTNVTLFRDPSGQPIGSQGVILDVSQQKEMLMRTEQARLAADAANRAKSAFLANMSHEIRTPMNGIIGMTELMLDTELTSEQRDHLHTVKSCAESLLTVINDVLDFTKIEAGKFELDSREFTLDELLGDTLRGLSVRAHQRGLELVYHIQPAVPARILGDPGRLRQILVNLIGNAIKFTEKGEIVVQVKQERRTGDRVLLLFSVVDTGIGIAQEKQADIFDAFAQVDGTNTRKYGGTGLGLTISARLVELFGGRIWVESEPGKGSAFYFTAEVGRAPNQTLLEEAAAVASLRGRSVLVVDDNATNRKVLQEMLTGWGMQPTLVESGAAALAAIQEQARVGDPFQLILIDCMMPGMDGFELAERMRADSAFADVKVMMLTSNNALGAAARCRELGLSAHLVKPIRRAELLHTICKSLARQPPEAETRSRDNLRTTARRKLQILLAEDNLVNQHLAVHLLTREGHTVDVAMNGKIAVEKHARRDYDAVLMDVQMPEMDGLEATAAIRAREATTGKRTPIIAMTAHAMPGDRERCLAAGMDDYISKPIDHRELLKALPSHCLESLADRPDANARAAVDCPAALQRCGGDEDLLREMCETYLAEQPHMMRAIHAAVAERDAAALHRSAHTLQGATSVFGAPRLCELAQRLEILGRDGDLGQAAPQLEALDREVSDLVGELSELRKGGAG